MATQFQSTIGGAVKRASCSVSGPIYRNPILSFRFPSSLSLPLSYGHSCRNLISSSPGSNSNWKYVKVKPSIMATYSGERGAGSYGDPDPFWMEDLYNDFISYLKSLIAFLAEQPAQLKNIEWPSFQDTLRTATLTLVLMAVFIVTLSTVDSALSYVLALILRRPG